MHKFVKFVLSGGLVYIINIWLTYYLINFIHTSKDLAYFISIISWTLTNFYITIKYIFKLNYSHKLLVKYIIALLSFSSLNYILVFSLKNIFIYNYYVLIFIVTTMIFFLKFIVYDKLVFINLKK